MNSEGYNKSVEFMHSYPSDRLLNSTGFQRPDRWNSRRRAVSLPITSGCARNLVPQHGEHGFCRLHNKFTSMAGTSERQLQRNFHDDLETSSDSREFNDGYDAHNQSVPWTPNISSMYGIQPQIHYPQQPWHPAAPFQNNPVPFQSFSAPHVPVAGRKEIGFYPRQDRLCRHSCHRRRPRHKSQQSLSPDQRRRRTKKQVSLARILAKLLESDSSSASSSESDFARELLRKLVKNKKNKQKKSRKHRKDADSGSPASQKSSEICDESASIKSKLSNNSQAAHVPNTNEINRQLLDKLDQLRAAIEHSQDNEMSSRSISLDNTQNDQYLDHRSGIIEPVVTKTITDNSSTVASRSVRIPRITDDDTKSALMMRELRRKELRLVSLQRALDEVNGKIEMWHKRFRANNGGRIPDKEEELQAISTLTAKRRGLEVAYNQIQKSFQSFLESKKMIPTKFENMVPTSRGSMTLNT